MQQATPRASDYPAPTRTNVGRGFTVAGFVCAVAAVFILPIVFGPLGAIFGFIGYGKGDKLGLWAGIAGIVAIFAGLALGALVLHATHHQAPSRY